MNIGIVGLGLMGASFGRTILKRTEHKVYGYDLDDGVMLKAELLTAMTSPLTEKNANTLDLLVISVYPNSFKEVAERYLPLLRDGATVIDFCGVKREIVTEMQRLSQKYPNVNFIGGHPMAGREFSGIDHSVTTLFDKASMLLVPVKADIFTVSSIKEFFLTLGFSEVIVTDADTHDKVIAFTSQLCHIVSNAFIKSPTAQSHYGYSAGSYKDMTRVARLNPKMWAQLMLANSDKLDEELGILIDRLQEYKTALDNKDGKVLEGLLKDGNDRKLSIDVKRSK